jgi:hypothetical protein
MLNPIFWGMTLVWWLDRPSAIARLFPAELYYIGMACWVLGGLTLLYSGVANARASGKPHLARAALLVPMYWGMMSLAAIKAFLQLVLQPSYWEKTTHGLSEQTVLQPNVVATQPVPVHDESPAAVPVRG